MELLPFLALISTGSQWLDHVLRIGMIVYVLYSIFLNALVASAPEYKEKTWVRVSLAFCANLNVLLSKTVEKPAPPPQGPYALPPVPNAPPCEVPTLRPEALTIPDRPSTPPEPPAAA